MHDLLIELTVPALNETFDITIPAAAQMHNILALAVQAIKALSNGRFQSDDPVLCDCVGSKPLSVNATPETLGIQNGTRLMLI